MTGFFESSFWTSGYPWGILLVAIMVTYSVLESRNK